MAEINLTSSGREKIRKALHRKGLKLESLWKQEVPVYRGRYKSSITTVVDDDADGIRVKVGTNVPYARVLEFGLSPGFPPVDELRTWVERKLGVPEEQSDQVAYLVGRKIAREGVDENASLQRALRRFRSKE